MITSASIVKGKATKICMYIHKCRFWIYMYMIHMHYPNSMLHVHVHVHCIHAYKFTCTCCVVYTYIYQSCFPLSPLCRHSCSLLLTTFCLEHRPTVVACVCIHLVASWKGEDFTDLSAQKNNWWEYVDRSVTQEKLDGVLLY